MLAILSSLKVKILVPVISVLVILVAVIIVVVSISKVNLTDMFEEDRMRAASQSVTAYLYTLRQQSYLAVTTIADSGELVRLVYTEDREGLIRYLQQRKELIGIDAFIVATADGYTLGRSHVPDFYGDFIGGIPHVALALQGHNRSAYALTPTVPLVVTSTSSIRHNGNIIGGIVANMDIGLNSFVDSLAEIFQLDFTVFRGDESIASTIVHPTTGNRAVGTNAAPHISAAVLERRESIFVNLNIFGMLPYLAYYFPLIGMDGNPIGMFFVGLFQGPTIGAREALQRNLIIFSLIGLAAAAVLVYFIVIRILKSFGMLVSGLDDIAHGDADLTKRIPEKGKDEVAHASRLFNRIMEDFRDLFVTIKNQAGLLDKSSVQLDKDMDKTASWMKEIVTSVGDLKNKLAKFHTVLTSANNGVEEIGKNVIGLGSQTDNQSQAVSLAASSIEEMLANIASVTNTLVKNTAAVKELRESSDAGRAGLHEVVANIQEIAKESEGLLGINAVMENVSSQTNLLSMNAAIQAAHAGDAGKGFAVVASEIRKLAESSADQTKNIGVVLKKIKSSIDKITISADNVQSRFEVIDYQIKTVANQEEAILHAMEEQRQGSKQVQEASSRVSDITRRVREDTIEMGKVAKRVMSADTELENLLDEINQGVTSIVTNTNEINKKVADVNDLSTENRRSTDILTKAVLKFKV